MKNYYQILNVTKISNLEDLLREYKRLYRTLEKEHDKKILNEAFDVLSNTESKNIYDNLLVHGHQHASQEAIKYNHQIDKRLQFEENQRQGVVAKTQKVVQDIIGNVDIIGSWGAMIGTQGVDTNPEGKNKGIVLKIYDEIKHNKSLTGSKIDDVFITSNDIRAQLSKHLNKQLSNNNKLIEYLSNSQEAKQRFAKMLTDSKGNESIPKVINQVTDILQKTIDLSKAVNDPKLTTKPIVAKTSDRDRGL